MRGSRAVASVGLLAAALWMTGHGFAAPLAEHDLSASAGASASVVIVPDESRKLADRFGVLLEEEGFEVRVAPWEDLRAGRLRGGRPDLVLLADARALPAASAQAVVSYLSSPGKVIAIGAPAFGQLLVKTPAGYVTQKQYGAVLYGLVAKRPVRLEPTGWSRACFRADRQASIQPLSDPPRRPSGEDRSASGAENRADSRAARDWKVSTDFVGWDNFSQPFAGAFADGHTLLCFARGDAGTPQLSIECRERDDSRWIATVELSTEWRGYALRPADFVHWPDSPARRGGPGDGFNPAHVASISIGLSNSHTPKCKPGARTLWFGDVSTAVDVHREASEYRVPVVEGLCPSHQLYPLVDTATLRSAHCLAESVLEATALSRSAAAGPAPNAAGAPIAFTHPGYSSVWREQGIGFDRGRACRWVRLLDAYDAGGRNRGALAWLMLGGTTLPGAMWANVGVADPALLASDASEAIMLRNSTVALARAMTDGGFLLEGGSRYFSYRPGETVELGALVMSCGRREARWRVTFDVRDAGGKASFTTSDLVTVPPGEPGQLECEWTPTGDDFSRSPWTITTGLFPELPLDESGEPGGGGEQAPVDSISHRIDLLPTEPAGPEEFVRVEGSGFVLGGQPWQMLGINYRPTSQGGRPTLRMLRREQYDPAVIERDLDWMESMGINTLSAIFAPLPPDPEAPGAYRDLADFLERCRRHGIKVFYFLHWGNPLPRADLGAIKRHIEAAGLKDHPAILAWELAWEPIHSLGSRQRSLEFLTADWNAWIVERYGSLAVAQRDWGFQLERVGSPTERRGSPTAKAELAAIPEHAWCVAHGPWDRAVAAFRRFFSDRVGQAYGEVVHELRRFDPNHLVTFRFGACGIPDQARFAHAHSAGVAKHVSFLCPEGYNLQTGGWGTPTPADDIRKGGLVTLYYRFLSREKPVVWMEFGYTVSGFGSAWETGREHISPIELARQRAEYEEFYRMFLESGARGAAPWWLPGGFRLGERSDFGVLEPDGTERPASEVLREYLPRFAEVPDGSCIASPEKADDESQRPVITLDMDAHYPDAWETYSPEYLEAVQSGRIPLLRTAGTGSTSADCPLLAVGNRPLDGHNPPQFLNAEFNAIEVRLSEEGPWRHSRADDVLTVSPGTEVVCRASIGNTAEAAWLAPKPESTDEEGAVYLACTTGPDGRTLHVPIAADTPYLADVQAGPFVLPLSAKDEQTVTFQMLTTRRDRDGRRLAIPFGQKRTVTIRIVR